MNLLSKSHFKLKRKHWEDFNITNEEESYLNYEFKDNRFFFDTKISFMTILTIFSDDELRAIVSTQTELTSLELSDFEQEDIEE